MPTPIVVDQNLANAIAAFASTPGALYLDSAAQGPRLSSVLDAGCRALEASASPWLCSFDELDARIESLRRSAADLVFEGDSDGIAMIPSAAFGIATAARNLPLQRGESVLVQDDQFPSNLLAWQQRCLETGATIVVVDQEHHATLADAVLSALDTHPNIRIVAIAQAHWYDGSVIDLDRVCARAHAMGAAIVLDLSQSLGAMPVNLAQWHPDFIVSVGYKWLLGPHGLGWLWASPRWRREGIGIDQHWSARDDAVWRFEATHAPHYRDGARRFDAGGVADPMRIAMAQAAFDQLHAWTVSKVTEQLAARTAAFDSALDAQGLGDWKTPQHAPHFSALKPPRELLDAVAVALLRERVICTRRAGMLRIAPHLHVGIDAMQRVVDIIAGAVR